MEFTKKYEQKKELILSFLQNYDTLEYDNYSQTVFDKDNNPLDYYLCEDDKCVEISKKELRKELPKRTRLFSETQSNDYDHDKFEKCNICEKPLNKDLTWYEDELDYLIEEIQSKEDIILAENAFKIVGLLQSVGWLSDKLNSKEAKDSLLMFIDKIMSFGIEM